MRPSTADVRLREDKEDEAGVGCSLAEFKNMGELGKGAYGVVYRVLSLKDGKEYVLKKIPIKHLKKSEIQDVVKEAKILRKVENQHIIKSYSHFVESGALNIIMEFAEGGDLQQLLKTYKKNGQTMPESEVWRIAEELTEALVYLHDNKIIHRDIKTLNVFLTKDLRVKLGDMGVSKVVKNSMAAQNTRVGTPLYLSPELVKQKPYDYKIDVWAMGCILYQLCVGKAPFTGENLISLGYNIVHNQPPPIPTTYSAELIDLIGRLLEKNPSKRPSSEEALSLIQSTKKTHKLAGRVSKPGEQEILQARSGGISVGANFGDLIDNPAKESEKVPLPSSAYQIADSPRRSSPWRPSPRRNRSTKALGKTESRQIPDMQEPDKRLNSQIQHEVQSNPAPPQLGSAELVIPIKPFENAAILKTEEAKDRSKQATERTNQNIPEPAPGHKKQSSQRGEKPEVVSVSKEKETVPAILLYDPPREDKPKEPRVIRPQNVPTRPRTAVAPPGPQAVRPQSGFGVRLVVNSRQLTDKVKCMEMMLKRATLNDPIHNMLMHKDNPQPPHQPSQKAPQPPPPPLDSTTEKPVGGDFSKREKKTTSTLQTSAGDSLVKDKDKADLQKKSVNPIDIIYQEEPMSSGVSHPFLNPFRNMFSTSATKPEVKMHKKMEEESEVEIEYRLDHIKNRARPQTASANLQPRYSNQTPSKPITGFDPIDKKNYRIKTAVPSVKKDFGHPLPSPLNRPSSASNQDFVHKRLTINDL